MDLNEISFAYWFLHEGLLRCIILSCGSTKYNLFCMSKIMICTNYIV